MAPTFYTICANLYLVFQSWKIIFCISFYLYEALETVISKLVEIGLYVVGVSQNLGSQWRVA